MIQRRSIVSSLSAGVFVLAGEPHIGALLARSMGASTSLRRAQLIHFDTTDTPFGTTSDPYSYLFKPSLAGTEADAASSATGWIRLTLPSTTDEAFPQSSSHNTSPTDESEPVDEENQTLFLKLRDSFEQALVELGLLTDSMMLSAADDIGQSTRASLGGIAQSIYERTRVRIEGSEAVKPAEEVQLGERTKNFVGGVEGASQGVRDVSNKLTGYIQQGSVWLGKQVVKRIPVGKKGEMEMEEGTEERPDMSTWEKTQTAVGSIASGVADGSTTLASHTSQAAQDAVTHSKGSDAGEVVEKASQTAANIGGTASDVVVKTSVALLGGMASKAAVEADRSADGDGGGDEQGEEEVRRA
ncbi:BQ5605_C016g08099 [Microbotryum silenes-dioicae]|uniref:BQ5605_C016g08099 protein n=1 Tax=Microbotryum silenes-dioicae TaxID=796604 RepID=A0A2X0MQ39_9BASI|nr:BQ5605_C016g08099 [Microbotryum silenes-dioicae]